MTDEDKNVGTNEGDSNNPEESQSGEETALALVENQDDTEGGGDGDVKNIELREEIKRLRAKMDEDYWALGVALEEAYRNDSYRGWGFDSWKEYVEEEVDVGLRTVQYLVKLQGWFETVTPAIQKWIRSLGWTKARMLMHVVTQENALEWKARVAGKTVDQIEGLISDSKKGISDDGGGGSGGESSDDDRENTFVKVSVLLSQAQKDLYDMAMTKAGEIADSDKPGHLFASIVQNFLAMNTDVLTKEDYLKEAERFLGWRLIAVEHQESTGTYEIVWGEEVVDLMRGEDGEEDDLEDELEGEDVEDNVGQNSGDDEPEKGDFGPGI